MALTLLAGGRDDSSVWDALSTYGSLRLEELERAGAPDDDARGVTVVLEICAQFYDISLEELFGDLLPRRDAATGLRSRSLDERWLLPALAPCVALFPYQCLVGSGVISRFADEVGRLARWCCERGLHGDDEHEAALAWLNAAQRSLDRHHAVQSALEPPVLGPPNGPDRLVVDGRFRIEAVAPGGITLGVPGERRYEGVRLPEALRARFAPGCDVCIAMARSVVGWIPLASTVPISPARLERVVAGWRGRLGAARRRPALVAR